MRDSFWIKPPQMFVKLNTVAALDGITGIMTFGGGLIRDEMGRWIGGFEAQIGKITVLLAEFTSFFERIVCCLGPWIS